MTASQFPHPLQPSASCVCHSLNWQTQGISFQFLLSLNSQLKLLTTPFFPKLFLFLASPSYLCYSSYFSPSKIPLKGWSSMFLCSRPSSLLSLHIFLGWLSTTPGPIFSGLFLHVHLQLSKLLELHTHSRHLTASRTCLLDILGCLTFNTWQMELFSLTPLASTSKIPCYEKSLFYLSFKPHNGEYSLIIPSLTFFFSSNSLVTRFSGFHFAWIHNHVCSFLAVCHHYICLCPHLHRSWLDHCSCLQLATQPFANFVQQNWTAWIWIQFPLHSGCVFGTGLTFLDCAISCYHLVYNSEYGSHRENWFGWI